MCCAIAKEIAEVLNDTLAAEIFSSAWLKAIALKLLMWRGEVVKL